MTTVIPSGEFRFIALDVETSCGDSASICQIGLACVRADHSIQTYATLVDPQLPFARFNIDLHGIGPDTVREAPTFPQIWPRLLSLLSRHPLVQHSRFDEKAIAAACKMHGLAQPRLHWTNSVSVARSAWPALKKPWGNLLKKSLVTAKGSNCRLSFDLPLLRDRFCTRKTDRHPGQHPSHS